MMDTTLFNTLLGVGAIIITIAILTTIVGLVWYRETTQRMIQKYFLWDGLLLALAGLVGSLIYSNFFGFPPCTLCWWQRIFLYPQIILFSIGLWGRGDKRTIALSSSILSGLGLLVSIYQYLLQMGLFENSTVCIGGTACASIDAIAFGFITIPMMCGILFLGILISSIFSLQKN
ncbi:MAG: disulfide bond formation protein B [Candidatus Pacebacteria bacterium]|nr:disulfide bond formation protein B [Candidatus Paceibacterota bacterium]